MRVFRYSAVLPVLALALLFGTTALADQGTTEKPFVQGGRIRMSLKAADYTIKAGREDRIVVSWETERDPDAHGRATIHTDIGNKSASIVTDGSHSMRVVIEVPPNSDLHIDVNAGNVRVRGITGSKDIGSWAGNIDIEVPRPDDYRLMDLAVKAGDIRAHGLGVNKSGLFRSYRRSGPGGYTLRVRLTAGNLRLIPE